MNPTTSARLRIEEFREFLVDHLGERDYAEQYLADVYFREPEGCLPEDYLGDDLFISIRDKFWYPIRWLADATAATTGGAVPASAIQIVIEPSYNDSTHVVVFRGAHLLFHETWKAWRFWWQTDGEFETWANEVLHSMCGRLACDPSSVS